MQAAAAERRKEAERCEGLANFYQRQAKQFREEADSFERVAKDPLWRACRHATEISEEEMNKPRFFPSRIGLTE
jgi:hypothetical protein